ncbi:metal-dependent phosphohydrolase, HD sub domain [Methanoregula boonei 6A8]|jgi:dGTPase|uniref:Metal-dependent phosphohydrolase, HD sub domain n=1 Tax=Methanoregula boonei (strain DSM 21154 / JCM 14090 / 6A8) TaxID=456442 RepID=A7I9S2_METB6|nr:HD domain-containing protein [Methanoregula boonei]ABS56483.1 metal-dependent phosphohydrolase, HD sub domain [Methanoregula boonei 6A8]
MVKQRDQDPDRNAAIFRYTREREALLSPRASRSDQALRRKSRKPEDIRTPYSRDADRILHTRAYTRYIDKTQVFYLVENDHITHRVIHVQLVSKIARTIGRCLRLNEDLIEAIALGHDIGHIPYGHFGEACLSDLCLEHGIGKFAHNVQSVRSLDRIEDQDLTMQVLDGILCHNGEAEDLRMSPESCPDWATFDRKVCANETGGRPGSPMTLEGCVVKFADTIAYIGRDLQDAQEVGLIKNPGEIPQECQEVFGSDNRAIIDTLIRDLLENSDADDKCFISYSREVEHALATLRAFSRHTIYNNPKLTAEREKIRTMYRVLFLTYLSDIESDRRSSKIFSDFINAPWVNREYLHTTPPAGLTRDFISGMTDRYFLKRFEDCVIPHRIEGAFR